MKIFKKDDKPTYAIEFNKTSGDEYVFFKEVKELKENVFKELFAPDVEEE